MFNRLNKYLLITLLVYSSSCTEKKHVEQAKVQQPVEYNFIFKENLNLYKLTKVEIFPDDEDTAWYFKDSLMERLLYFNTLVIRGGAFTINQSIKPNPDGSFDPKNSYYFNFDKEGDQLHFSTGGLYGDTNYLIIGEIDSNYRNIGRVDSFAFEDRKLSIPDQPYYERARLGVFDIIGKDTLHGKELYIPKGMLEDAR